MRFCRSTRELRLRTGFLGGRLLAFFAISHSCAEISSVLLAGALGLGHKWQQRYVTSTLDRHRQLTLMPGACTGLAPRANLAPIG
jgi:hypothetical protein